MQLTNNVYSFDDGFVLNTAYNFESFKKDIIAFNNMYRVGVNKEWDAVDAGARMLAFHSIIEEEFDEGPEAIQNIYALEDVNNQGKEDLIAAKVNLSDWFGDIIVYCVSEYSKFHDVENGESITTPTWLTHQPKIVEQRIGLCENVSPDNSVHEPMVKFLALLENCIGEKAEDTNTVAEIKNNLMVFCHSVVDDCAFRLNHLGVDPNIILQIIMASNMSKLGVDGNPIYDERGKVQKGPNYWKPEPKIREYIEYLWKLNYNAA